MDRVLLCEFLGHERLPQGAELRERILDDLRAARAAEEERRLGVLDGFWLALLEGALGARVARFSVLGLEYLGIEAYTKVQGGMDSAYIWRSIAPSLMFLRLCWWWGLTVDSIDTAEH